YHGSICHQTSEQLSAYLKQQKHTFVFVGFNALNNAEQKIIQGILQEGRGEIYWDIDRYFLKNHHHDAGLFIRRYKKEWNYYNESGHSFNGGSDFYTSPKNIQSIGIPKNVGQAKYVGEILNRQSPKALKNTALVLNEEGLLSPILNALPENVDYLNITMGLPLKATPLSAFFEVLFKIQLESTDQLYYKNVLDVLDHPAINLVIHPTSEAIRKSISAENRVYMAAESLLEKTEKGSLGEKILRHCFTDHSDSPGTFLEALISITTLLRPEEQSEHPLETEYLYHFHQVFNKLQNLLKEHPSVPTLKSLHRIYKDLLQTESLDFTGSPFDGLQLMGMLETRALDFETLILTSVNEGILPSGKSANSFIPYDLKKEYGL